MRGFAAVALLAGLQAPSGVDRPEDASERELAKSAVSEAAQAHRELDQAACVRCHTVQAEEWRGSSHQTSFTESTFQTALAIEPAAFCRECHAPQADPASGIGGPGSELGVACVSCHVQDGELVAVADDSGLRTASCVACHEFPFPGNALRDRPLLMQTTGLEHAASRFATSACADCHMKVADDGHHDHRFVASRDPELVRSAVHVEAERTGDTVRVTLRAGRVGHAFPTGDLLRRIEVGAAVDGEPEQRTYLARHFGDRIQRNGAWMRSLLGDNRVPPDGERVVELRIPSAQGRAIRWWVQYQRVAHQRSFDPSDAAIDGTVDIAQGTL